MKIKRNLIFHSFFFFESVEHGKKLILQINEPQTFAFSPMKGSTIKQKRNL